MTKFRKSLLIFGILALVIGSALATAVGLSLAGLLKSEKIELTFTVIDAEKTYDGTPLKASQYELTDGRYIEGHEPKVITFTGERTDVGVSFDAGMEVKMVDKNSGRDVTNEYSIKVINGSLTVNASGLNIVVDVDDIVYDGTTVGIGDNYHVEGATLATGHKVLLSIKDEWYENAGRIVAGKTLTGTDFDALIVDSSGRDVTDNYRINEIRGRVTVRPRVITLAPVSVSKTYDGTPLTCNAYNYAPGSLTIVSNHRLIASYVAMEGGNNYATDANEDNPLKIQANGTIYDFDGMPVTDNYLIYSETATVTIKRAPLEIVAKSERWQYADIEYTLANDHEADSVKGLVGNDKVTVDYDKTITDVSVVINDIVAYYINGDAYNTNYIVTLKPGTLEVTRAPITVKWQKIEKQYGKNFDGDLDELYVITTDVDDFDVDKLELSFIASDLEAVINGVKVLGGSSYVFNEFMVLSNKRDRNITKMLTITVVAGNLDLSAKEVTLAVNSLSKTYDGDYTFDGDGVEIDDLVEGHFVSSITCSAPANLSVGTKSVTIKSIIIVDEFGNNVTGYYNITNFSASIQINIEARPITVKSESVEKVYDGTALYRGVVTADRLALGDRIDYLFDVVKDAIDDKNTPSKLSILNIKNEDVTGFYTITEDFGTLVIEQKKVTVYLPDNCQLEYEENYFDKVAQYVRCTDIEAANFTVTRDTGSIIGIHTVQFDWSDSPVVENTDNYEIVQGNNTFTVIKKQNTSKLTGVTPKEYDGNPLTQDEILGYVTYNGDIEYFYSNLLGVVDAGSYGAEIICETAYEKYTVTGTYTIKALEIRVNATLTSVYDGKPFRPSASELTAERGYSVSNFTLNRDVINVCTEQSIGFRTVEFVDGQGRAVSTNNVKVSASSSITVSITQRKLEITLSPAPSGVDVSSDLRGLINIFNVAADDVVDLSGVWVAIIGNTTFLTPTEIKIFDKNGNDVSRNYDFPKEDIMGIVSSN